MEAGDSKLGRSIERDGAMLLKINPRVHSVAFGGGSGDLEDNVSLAALREHVLRETPSDLPTIDRLMRFDVDLQIFLKARFLRDFKS